MLSLYFIYTSKSIEKIDFEKIDSEKILLLPHVPVNASMPMIKYNDKQKIPGLM